MASESAAQGIHVYFPKLGDNRGRVSFNLREKLGARTRLQRWVASLRPTATTYLVEKTICTPRRARIGRRNCTSQAP